MQNIDYWIKRKKQNISSYWKKADNLDNRLKKEYAKAFKELEKELYTFWGKYSVDDKLTYSQKRIIQLMKEIKPHIDNLYDNQQTSVTDLLIDSFEDNYLKEAYTISIGTNIGVSFVKLNKQAIKTAISFPWSGENFSDRIYSNKNKLMAMLKQELTQAIIRGNSVQDTSRIVAKRLNISYSNAKTLVQTEMGAVLSESDKASYKEFNLDKYEYLSTLDNRTSETCKELDGKIFDVKDYTIGVNAPPMHPHCRSTTIPYFDDEEGQRIAKNLDSGKYEYVPSNMTYKEWERKFVK